LAITSISLIMKTVYCIGEALIDFVGEKQGSDLSKAREFTRKAGGAPANVACAIARLGGSSSFIGSVGDDPFGKYLLDTLQACGVDIRYAQQSDIFTTLAFVSLAEDGERDFIFSRGADRELTYDPEVKKLFGGNIIHFGAATALMGGPLEEAYHQYLSDASEAGAFICFDPNFRQDLWNNKEQEFIQKCQPFLNKAHLCKFSLEEARILSGREDLQAACEALHKDGPRLITITLGSEGTCLSGPHGRKTIPSIKITPVDTTGAGDAFIGCLLYQLAGLRDPDQLFEKDSPLVEMIAQANRAGAITATNYGAIESLPDQEQLRTFV